MADEDPLKLRQRERRGQEAMLGCLTTIEEIPAAVSGESEARHIAISGRRSCAGAEKCELHSVERYQGKTKGSREQIVDLLRRYSHW